MICKGKTCARIEEVTKLSGLRGGKYSAVSSSMNNQLLDVYTGFYWEKNIMSKDIFHCGWLWYNTEVDFNVFDDTADDLAWFIALTIKQVFYI